MWLCGPGSTGQTEKRKGVVTGNQQKTWLFETWLLFFHTLGISSSQLTNSYFSEGWLNHQPDNLLFISVGSFHWPSWNMVRPVEMSSFILWMQEILHHQKDGWKPIDNGINHLSTGGHPNYDNMFVHRDVWKGIAGGLEPWTFIWLSWYIYWVKFIIPTDELTRSMIFQVGVGGSTTNSGPPWEELSADMQDILEIPGLVSELT